MVIICTIAGFFIMGILALILQGLLYISSLITHWPIVYGDSVVIIIACIGGILGFWFGTSANSLAWKEELEKDIDDIKRLVYRSDIDSLKSSCLAFLEKYHKKHILNTYTNRFNSEKQKLISDLQDILQAYAFKERTNLEVAISASAALKILTSDVNYETIIKLFTEILEQAGQFPLCIEFVSYGNCALPFDDPLVMQKLENNSSQLLNHYDHIFSELKRKQNFAAFKDVVQLLDKQTVYTLCLLMWYYAKHTPIDLTSFKKARFFYQMVTIPDENQNFDDEVRNFATMEDLFSTIYVRNLLGLDTGKKEETDYINSWITSKIQLGEIDDCFRMCSGLAWINANDYEKDILLELFSAQVQLPEYLQDRLTYLSSGEKSEVKLYHVEPSNLLLYDSSSSEWDIKDYDSLFYEATLRRIPINYSLAIESFSKIIPLQPGFKDIYTQIANALSELISDYDGDIIKQTVSAKAINIANDVIFDGDQFIFNIEQCPYASILFLAEKYGRTLNVNLITLFTPNNDVDLSSMQSYVLSMKNNSYIISFKESLLQIIDNIVIGLNGHIYDE